MPATPPAMEPPSPGSPQTGVGGLRRDRRVGEGCWQSPPAAGVPSTELCPWRSRVARRWCRLCQAQRPFRDIDQHRQHASTLTDPASASRGKPRPRRWSLPRSPGRARSNGCGWVAGHRQRAKPIARMVGEGACWRLHLQHRAPAAEPAGGHRPPRRRPSVAGPWPGVGRSGVAAGRRVGANALARPSLRCGPSGDAVTPSVPPLKQQRTRSRGCQRSSARAVLRPRPGLDGASRPSTDDNAAARRPAVWG